MNDINPENIPQELRDRRQWVAWRYEDTGGPKPRKKPYSPLADSGASSVNPEHWCSLDEALAYARAREMAGVMFAITADDPYVGIDLDECRDPETGELHTQAREIIETFNTYTEISPSGTGVKMVGRGQKPEGSRCKSKDVAFKEIEVYDHARFFTVTTAVHEEHTDLRDISSETVELCERWLAPRVPAQANVPCPTTPLTDDDDELLNRIRRSKNGTAFDALWSGDIAAHGHDASDADFAMAGTLAFWTRCDAERIERMMMQSGLVRPKWNTMRDEQTYLQYTIQNVIARTNTVYDPGYTSSGESAGCSTGIVHCDAADFSAFHNEEEDEDFSEFHDDLDCDPMRDHIESVIRGKMRSIPWPWEVLDPLTQALAPGTLTILVGAAGSSKSLAMMQAMTYWHEQGINASCLMLESDRNAHLMRALAQKANNANLVNNRWVETNGDVVRQLYDQHKALMQSLAAKIHTPPSDQAINLNYIHHWLKQRGEMGSRILVVDPITMIDDGDAWDRDKRLLRYARSVAEDYKLSVVLVTHPNDSKRKPNLGDIAGGKSINRFSDTVLWLEKLKASRMATMSGPGTPLTDENIDRVLHILKARSGNGTGHQIGVLLDRQTLRLELPGVIVENNEVAFDGDVEREALGIQIQTA